MQVHRRIHKGRTVAVAASFGAAALALTACGTGEAKTSYDGSASPSASGSPAGGVDMFVDVDASVSTPADGRVAVPVKFGWKGGGEKVGAELRMTVENGFTWAAVASLGNRVDDRTVSIPYESLPESGMTKARLKAPGNWDADKPVLTAELVPAGAASPASTDPDQKNNRGSAKAVNKVPGVDLFMFPPPTRSTADASGVVSYAFDYGSQGSRTVKGAIELTPFDGYSWAETPAGCTAASRTSPMTCDVGEVPKEATFNLKVKVPDGAEGVQEAVRYDIKPVGAQDENPANNNGVRYAGSGPAAG
ncbi:hypothetical protein ACFWZ2_38745 [Streptomyces sp. NPDC059002]|uniref:hypothetical protein n=1 Tax=Streptomyces sp. NPDC059002 TaxID=3346690 RepID=UPI00367D76D1